MIKTIYKLVLTILVIIGLLTTYLSTIGIKTNRLNNQISSEIKNINNDLNIELNDVNILLDPFNLRFLVKTIGTNLIYKNEKIQLESIKSAISIKSLLGNRFSLNQLDISTKSIQVNNLITFIRLLTNDPKFFILQKLVKKGFIIAEIKIEFDETGNIKKDFLIEGVLKEGKVDFLKNYNLSKIDSNFSLNNNKIEFDKLSLLMNGKNLSFPSSKIEKIDDKFLVSGNLNNDELTLNNKDIKVLFGTIFSFMELDNIIFESENEFTFEINKKFKIDNFKINSNISLKNLMVLNQDLSEFFPKSKKEIRFKNHQLQINFQNNEFSIGGSGYISLEKDEKIKYKIFRKKNKIFFDTSLEVLESKFSLNNLNYQKENKSILNINIKGSKDIKNNFYFDEILLNEKDNKIFIKDLSLGNNLTFNKFKKIDLNYLDIDGIKNNISIIRKSKSYLINGEILNLNKIIDDLLFSDDTKQNIFNKSLSVDLNIKKVYLDKDNFLKNLKGFLNFKKGVINQAKLVSRFSNESKIRFTVESNNNRIITTLFSENAKPLVDRYKFIKGFNEGSLDFYSVKKNDVSNSTLKIYNFKLKELPALTKLLTLASLQGIADLLSGEGIRFNEFEMNFENKDQIMTIEEIYAIGPAISILMSGYIEKNKLISLRGTLVPATTLNKTIGSIPFLGDILVGKKTGEGVFGVSFKIKGPPKKLETSVNPIKTLTPRFITRTLEKIKRN